MPIDLPAPIAAYFKARNDFDIDAALVPFDPNAVVKDESEEHRGRRAIRSWVQEATHMYHPKIEPKEATETAGKTIVSALVSGDFPGSPVLLDHAFTLSGHVISELEID